MKWPWSKRKRTVWHSPVDTNVIRPGDPIEAAP